MTEIRHAMHSLNCAISSVKESMHTEVMTDVQRESLDQIRAMLEDARDWLNDIRVDMWKTASKWMTEDEKEAGA